MSELAGTRQLYVILNLFCALTLTGSEPPTNIVRIHMMRRESIVPYPHGEGPPIITLVQQSSAGDDDSPASITDDDSDPEHKDAQDIDAEIDRYLTELRNQDVNEEQPGLPREPARRNLAAPAPPRQLSFWERVSQWCACSRERRR